MNKIKRHEQICNSRFFCVFVQIFMTDVMIDFPIFKFLAHFHSLEKYPWSRKLNFKKCESQTIVMIKFTFSDVFSCLFLWWAADGFRTRIFSLFFSYIFKKKKKKLNELQTEVSSFMQIAANKLGATQESDEESLLKKKVKIFE